MSDIISVTVVVRDGAGRKVECNAINTSANGGLMLLQDGAVMAEFQPQAWSYYRVERGAAARVEPTPPPPQKVWTLSVSGE